MTGEGLKNFTVIFPDLCIPTKIQYANEEDGRPASLKDQDSK